MKTFFAIGNENIGCDILLVEIGDGYCCYALLEDQKKTFVQIKYFTYDAEHTVKELTEIFNKLKERNCRKIVVSVAFSQALLIPATYGYNDSLLNLIYDLPFQKQFSDKVPEWQLVISYSMPLPVFNLIEVNFPSAEFFHAYTPVLKIYNGFVASNQIDIHFTPQHFRVAVKKEKQVLLLQTYSYKTPLDVVYFLLKICYEFKLHQSEVFVIIAGLIEQDSGLYNELHNYFLNLHFAQAPAYSLPENDHPHHYFTSLYNLAACVS